MVNVGIMTSNSHRETDRLNKDSSTRMDRMEVMKKTRESTGNITLAFKIIDMLIFMSLSMLRCSIFVICYADIIKN